MKNIILLVIAMAMFSSCSKDLLNKKPLDAYSDEDVWKDLRLVETFVNNMYKVLPNYGWANRKALILSCVSDEGYTKFNYNSANSVFNNGLLTPDNSNGLDIWTENYSTIRSCNIFFSKIDQVPGDESFRNRLKGEAHFFRAYAYFELISRYGGVPLIKKPFGLQDDFKVERSSYDECVKFVTDELDVAAGLLPLQHTEANLGRPAKGAALAIKSRLLLYAASPLFNVSNETARWQKAADAAKAVLDLNVYNLYTGSYGEIFTQPFNPEVIFQRLHSPDWQWKPLDTYLSPCSFNGWSAYAPSQNLVDEFEMANGKMITEAGSGFDATKPYIGRDPRFYANILYDGAWYRGYSNGGMVDFSDQTGKDGPNGIMNWNYSETRYNFRKYTDSTVDLDLDINNGQKQPWVISRITEIYLNYTEAKFYLGDEATAILYLNKVRQRAGINMPAIPATTTGAALEEKIRHERLIELCLEGHRYFDVRRWKIATVTENKPIRGVRITKQPDGSRTFNYYTVLERKFLPQHYLLPIPKAEMDRVKLQQNPNY